MELTTKLLESTVEKSFNNKIEPCNSFNISVVRHVNASTDSSKHYTSQWTTLCWENPVLVLPPSECTMHCVCDTTDHSSVLPPGESRGSKIQAGRNFEQSAGTLIFWRHYGGAVGPP